MPAAETARTGRAGRPPSSMTNAAGGSRRRRADGISTPEQPSGIVKSSRLSSTRAATAAATAKTNVEKTAYTFSFSQLSPSSTYKYLISAAPHLGNPLTYETAMYPCRLQAQARRNKARRLKKQKGNGSMSEEDEEGSEQSAGAQQDQGNGAESTPAPLKSLDAGGRWSFDEGLLPFEDARGTHGMAAARADEIWERTQPLKEQDVISHFLYSCRMRCRQLKLDMP